MSNHPRPKCRCGTIRDLPPDTKVLCTKCGMAFETFRSDDEARLVVRAEDLRDRAIRRSPAEVLAEMKAEAAAQPEVTP